MKQEYLLAMITVFMPMMHAIDNRTPRNVNIVCFTVWSLLLLAAWLHGFMVERQLHFTKW